MIKLLNAIALKDKNKTPKTLYSWKEYQNTMGVMKLLKTPLKDKLGISKIISIGIIAIRLDYKLNKKRTTWGCSHRKYIWN